MAHDQSKIQNQESKMLYLDPFSGIAGDMLLGALLDLGLDLAAVERELSKLKLDHCHLHVQRVMRGAISAAKFEVEEDGHEHEHGHVHGNTAAHNAAGTAVWAGEDAHRHHHEHRTYADIKAMIAASALSERVKADSIRVFGKLAEAEGKIHNKPPEQVNFHEVGALDSIVDIVGACIGLELLGIEEVRCGPVALGSGMVKCQHGLLPVPAPATAELMRGIPTRETPVQEELTTPTGAAILASLATSFGPMPDMTVEKIGYGAGSRDNPALPNVLRVFLGRAEMRAESESSDTIVEIRTNLDDVAPEVLGYLSEKLLAQGALDVFFTSIQMKKARPATLVTVLAEPQQLDAVAALLFTECGTFGLRYSTQSRLKLARRNVAVNTSYGLVNVKVGEWQGKVVGVHPEFEDCRKCAEEKGVPLRAVMEAARAAYVRQP